MKSSIIGCILAFSAGAAAGALVTWKTLDTKYERIAQEKIKSIKEAYSVKKPDIAEEVEQNPDRVTPTPDEEPAEQEENQFSEYENLTDRYVTPVPKESDGTYRDYANMIKPVEIVDDDDPYVIDPVFAGGEDYEIVSYTHYADGILTDDLNRPVEDIPGTVGRDYAEHFGDYEEDSVYIRNDRLRKDFEILRDGRRYVDLMTRGPKLGDD